MSTAKPLKGGAKGNSAVCLTAVLEAIWKFVGTSDVPMQQLLTLLHVSERGEVPMADLEKLTGVGQSSVSRNVAKLGPGPTPKDKGYGLVEAFEDPWYRKRKLVRLTQRGRALMVEIDRAFLQFQ